MPQYHIKHDDFFETVSKKNSNLDSQEPEWKRLSGLVKNGNKKCSDSKGEMSPTCIYNTTKLDDLNDIKLSPDSEQDQREAGPNNQTETNPNHVHHQQETVLQGSEGETTTDMIPNSSVTKRSGRNTRRTQRMEESAQQREQGIVAILKGLHSKQMDFMLAYHHAPAEVPLYMQFPKGNKFKN